MHLSSNCKNLILKGVGEILPCCLLVCFRMPGKGRGRGRKNTSIWLLQICKTNADGFDRHLSVLSLKTTRKAPAAAVFTQNDDEDRILRDRNFTSTLQQTPKTSTKSPFSLLSLSQPSPSKTKKTFGLKICMRVSSAHVKVIHTWTVAS